MRKTDAENMIGLIVAIHERSRVMPDGDTHVFVLHPAMWYDVATGKKPGGLTQEPPRRQILAHVVVGTLRGIPIIVSNNAPMYQAHLLTIEELEANVRRGLRL